VTLADGRILIGRVGVGAGEMFQPADVFVDSEENVWVADSRNNRVQKFNAEGRFLAGAGQNMPSPLAMNEPWSMAVDGEGFVYVADTWNHRILKLSPRLEQVATWGEPAVRPNPGLLELFGPRDIIVATDGTLWVTDTGNKRLINYTRDGEPIGVLSSGAGDFQEPVGLVQGPNGDLLVADAWNGRVQRLDTARKTWTSFNVGWTGRDVLAKPYVAVLADGRIVASDPGKGLLLLFDGEGRPLGSWKPDSDVVPLGVAALSNGGFVFSDGQRGQVQIVPGTLVGSLFK